MPNFTLEEIRSCMDHADLIRNISVIAHVDHGKSTLTDSLIACAGIISMGAAGNQRYTDTRQDEQDRCITIKSTGVSLYYEFSPDEKKEDTKGYLINLIDSPGHVDFSSEVSAALRVTDGALVVVDCVSGVCVQTETVLRQALNERVVPVLMLNKVDRVIQELQCSGEDAYKIFEKTVGQVNELISTYQDKGMRDLTVDPSKGTCCFGAGLQGWAFTITHFARLYSRKFGGDESYWLKNLWGNHFFNPDKNVWTNQSTSDDGSKTYQRGFAMYIMDPILNLFRYVLNDQKKKYTKLLNQLDIKLTPDEEAESGKKLLKCIMQKFLPAAQALLEMIITNLPSPVVAQKYRVDTLYMGPKDDECYKAIQACDKAGPLVLYISKMVPTPDRSRFYAFGRVFSGTVATGQKVNIMGSQFVYGKKKDYFTKNIQRTVLMMGAKVEQVDDIPCGNTVGLVGIDQYIIKSGTITTIDNCYPIRPMKFSVSPVVRVAIQAQNPKDLPKLQEGMKRLEKSDPCVQVVMDEETGENIIAGVGELHLEICLKDLREDFCNNSVPIVISEPVVTYRETVTQPSGRAVMAKSQNKHNRLYFESDVLSEEVIKAIEDGDIASDQDPKTRARLLADKFGWDVEEARKIWNFGPEGANVMRNILLEATKGVQYLHESKDHINGGFQAVCRNGVLCHEELQGACFKLKDATLHADALHRGAGQLVPCARSAMYACQLLSAPRLLEPIYLVEILTPDSCMGAIYQVMSKRRGQVISEVPREGQPLSDVKAYLPVGESFGFDPDLRAQTSGQAFPQCVFSHYALIESDPLQANSMANKIVMQIRKRKNLKDAIPQVSDYEDRM